MTNILDSNYINEYIIERCNTQTETGNDSKQYAYAKDHASFLKIIKTCEDIDKLQEIRNHIIAEIMQAGHLQDLRKASAKEKDAFETLNKAAQLKQRDLSRYMKQLSLSKLECERRLAVLGRPDFMAEAHLVRALTSHLRDIIPTTTTPDKCCRQDAWWACFLLLHLSALLKRCSGVTTTPFRV